MIAIIGGGFSGLTTSFFLSKKNPDLDITIFEKNTIGGDIKSPIVDNTILDVGSFGIYAKNPLFHYLIEELKLEDQLLYSSNIFDTILIPKDNYLNKTSIYLDKLKSSDVFFIGEKFKIRQMFKKKFSIWNEMSIYDFFKNVFGQTSADYIASALIRGYFLSEAEDIELGSSFPDIYNELKQIKSLNEVLDSLNKIDEAKVTKFISKLKNQKKFKPGFYSLQNGLCDLIEKIKNYLVEQKVNIVNQTITKIIPNQDGQYWLHSKNNKYGPFKQVIFTSSIQDVGNIFKDHNMNLYLKCKEQQTTYATEVFHIWNKKDFSSIGHGVYWPRISKSPIWSTIFISNLFKRTDNNTFITKNYMTGDGDIFNEDDLSRISKDHLKRYFKIKTDPIFSKVYKSNIGLPKFYKGYTESRNNILEMIHKDYPNIYLHGTYFSGIHLNQLLDRSYQLSEII